MKCELSKTLLFTCSSGLMLVLVFTFSFDSSLIIPKAYAVNLIVEQNTCKTTLNGFWDVPNNACITPGFAVDSTDSLTIPSGVFLVVNIGGTITNSGTINNNGGIGTGGTINNNSGGIINNNGGGFFDNIGGTITNSGTINNNIGGTFINSGTIDNYCHATLTNNGAFTGNLVVTLCNVTTTTTLSSLQNSSTFSQQVTFTATVSPSSATGTIQFQVDGTDCGSLVTLSGGTATLVTSSLSVGTHSVTASYGGDSNFAGNTSSALTQTVNKRVTITSITPNPASIVIGKSIQFTATVTDTDTGAVTNPSGHVTFSSGGEGSFSPSSCALLSGACAVTYTPSSSGSITITGSYLGDSTHDTSSGTSTVTVLGDGHGHGNDDNEGNSGNHEGGDNHEKDKTNVNEEKGHDNG